MAATPAGSSGGSEFEFDMTRRIPESSPSDPLDPPSTSPIPKFENGILRYGNRSFQIRMHLPDDGEEKWTLDEICKVLKKGGKETEWLEIANVTDQLMRDVFGRMEPEVKKGGEKDRLAGAMVRQLETKDHTETQILADYSSSNPSDEEIQRKFQELIRRVQATLLDSGVLESLREAKRSPTGPASTTGPTLTVREDSKEDLEEEGVSGPGGLLGVSSDTILEVEEVRGRLDRAFLHIHKGELSDAQTLIREEVGDSKGDEGRLLNIYDKLRQWRDFYEKELKEEAEKIERERGAVGKGRSEVALSLEETDSSNPRKNIDFLNGGIQWMEHPGHEIGQILKKRKEKKEAEEKKKEGIIDDFYGSKLPNAIKGFNLGRWMSGWRHLSSDNNKRLRERIDDLIGDEGLEEGLNLEKGKGGEFFELQKKLQGLKKWLEGHPKPYVLPINKILEQIRDPNIAFKDVKEFKELLEEGEDLP